MTQSGSLYDSMIANRPPSIPLGRWRTFRAWEAFALCAPALLFLLLNPSWGTMLYAALVMAMALFHWPSYHVRFAVFGTGLLLITGNLMWAVMIMLGARLSLGTQFRDIVCWYPSPFVRARPYTTEEKMMARNPATATDYFREI